MKLIENIKSLADVMKTIEQLDNPEFVQEQGLSEEDIVAVRDELKSQIGVYKSEIKSYIEYKLLDRQEHVILANGISNQIKGLSARMDKEANKIEQINSWIDYLCKIADITELKTPIAEIKYTGGEKMKVADNSVLPDHLKKYVFTHTIESENESDKKTLIEKGYTENIVYSGLPEIKKWFKSLKSGWDKEILELGKSLNAGVIRPEEYEEEMKNIKEEQKKYEGKIRIDDSKSLSIK